MCTRSQIVTHVRKRR